MTTQYDECPESYVYYEAGWFDRDDFIKPPYPILTYAVGDKVKITDHFMLSVFNVDAKDVEGEVISSNKNEVLVKLLHRCSDFVYGACINIPSYKLTKIPNFTCYGGAA